MRFCRAVSEDLLCGLEADDAFEGGDGVLAVRRDEFGDLVSWHALFLKGRVGQLLADVIGHLDDHSHWIRHAGFLHPLHHIRRIVIEQVPTELFGFLGDAWFNGSARCESFGKRQCSTESTERNVKYGEYTQYFVLICDALQNRPFVVICCRIEL